MNLSETTIEYAVHDMFKGKSLSAAAKRTAKQFSGSENMFLGSGVIKIDVKELEEALWDRMVEKTLDSLVHIRAGKEHFALDGTIDFYHQSRYKKERSELKDRVIERLGSNPFTNDDGGA